MAGLNLPTYLKGEETKEATVIKEEKKVFYPRKPKEEPKKEDAEGTEGDSPK